MKQRNLNNGKSRMSDKTSTCAGPGYASPREAIKAPREKIVYTVCIYTGTGIEKQVKMGSTRIHSNIRCPRSRKGRQSEADPEKQDKLHFLFWRLCANLLGSGSLHCTGCNFSSKGIAFVRAAPHLAR